MLALQPVLNQDSDYLFKKLREVLDLALDLGLNVVGVVSDNNKVNTKAVGLFCGGKDRSKIGPSFPYEHAGIVREIAFLSDYVHGIMNVRNNWVNQVCYSLLIVLF
jgi:hypothetical protein